MKRIGILGGTSPESTVSYYERITREYTRRFGNYAYPEIVIYSVSFQEFVAWQREGNWDAIATKMAEIFCILADAGAEIGLIAANTLHRVFDAVANESPIPLLHIVDATAAVIKAKNFSTVGLLGTRYTMQEAFYVDRLTSHGISTIIPEKNQQEEIHRVIYEELTRGIIKPSSKDHYLAIIASLKERGADGIILGCTEIPLLVQDGDCDLPLFDTAIIHADAALEEALK
ncbi:TPA: aspartate/glutamate racemase [Candidatus Acetothermia bacterium]|nr:aspartate/glutamate racemase [Candidatus Acetothermia bacterium]